MMGSLAILLVSQNIFAKVAEWTYDVNALSVIQAQDGGYAIAGYTYFNDMLVIKLSSNGSLGWARIVEGGSTGIKIATSVVQTPDGGFAVAGEAWIFNGPNYYPDVLVVKFSSTGTVQWMKIVGGASYDGGLSMALTRDSGLAIAGYTRSFGAGEIDWLVLKLSSQGDMQWAKTFGGTNYERAYSVTGTYDGGIAVTGNYYDGSSGSALVVKLAPNGDVEWARSYGAPDSSYTICSIIQTPDSGFAIAGYISDYMQSDALAMKLSSSGDVEWARCVGPKASDWDIDFASSIARMADSGYVVTGNTFSYGAWGDCLVFKLDSSGNLAWARTFAGEDSYDSLASVTQTSDGACLMVGRSNGFGEGWYSIPVLKLRADGDYSGCVVNWSPPLDTPSVTVSAVSVGANCSPSARDTTLTVNSPSLQVYDVCPPSSVGDDGPATGDRAVICSIVPGGALFIARGETGIRIYSVDGRVAYSGHLDKGQNRIPLETGVYLWRAGPYKGKAVVK